MTTDRNQQFERWIPLANTPSEVEIEAIHDDREGFRIVLLGGRDRKTPLVLQFDDPPMFRYWTETYRSLDLFEPGTWCFYKANSSDAIREFHAESVGIYEGRPFVHYVILASNAMVEVITEREPLIKSLSPSEPVRDA